MYQPDQSSSVGLTASTVESTQWWSDTVPSSDFLPSPQGAKPVRPVSPVRRVVDEPQRVTSADLTALLMVSALAITAIGLSASGVIYLCNELMRYSALDLLNLIEGIR